MRRENDPATWDDFIHWIESRRKHWRETGGAELRILSGNSRSPTLARLRGSLLHEFPEARWHVYEPIHRDSERLALGALFGAPLLPVYHLSRASYIVSLDADFLGEGAASVRWARDYAGAREDGAPLYVAEGAPTITGAMASRRLAIRRDRVPFLARALARALSVDVGVPLSAEENAVEVEYRSWLSEIGRRASSGSGGGVFLAGREQNPETHAIVHLLNSFFSARAKTVEYIDARELSGEGCVESIRALAGDISRGRVRDLILLGGNPAWDAPSDLDFGEKIARVPVSAHLASHEDETSKLCHWHLPETHELESWGDAQAYDGTVTIQQPALRPLYPGKSAIEVVSILLGWPGGISSELVKETWKARETKAAFERFWFRSVHDGVMSDSAATRATVSLNRNWRSQVASAPSPSRRKIDRVSTGRFDMGRTLREQWLASRAAETDHETDVGKRGSTRT